jgi:glutathione synthase/RimK-type ligase-like ATP-grasp enzyme
MTKPLALPVVYVVFRQNAGPASTRFGGFVRRLMKSGAMPKAEYKAVALEELMFALGKDGSGTIYTSDGTQVFHDASFVYFKSWEGMPEHAAMVVSYLQAKGIPFEDQAVRHAGIHKASQFWKLWSAGVPVIPTIVASARPERAFVETILGDAPYLVKPIHGEKGRGVEKIDSYDDIPATLTEFVLQPFITNDGDYRVMTYGYTVRGALLRSAGAGKVVNNTSQGGTSAYVGREKLQDSILKIAEKAARVTEHAVAGVDVIVTKDNTPYVLEVNQGSQIVTGHFTDKKIAAFGEFMNERVGERYARTKQNAKLDVIGRYVNVNFPEFGVKQVFAKVDTGAYQSSVHATDICEVEEGGVNYLEFSLFDGHGKTAEHKIPKCRVAEYEITTVKNSFGLQQKRYVIKTRIAINGRMMKTGITLADRKDMVAPVLLGRRFLRGRYVVNVELSRIGWEKTL